MAEKYTRKKYGLNDFYMEYVHYKRFNLRVAEAYSGLYKMYGGKKEVMDVRPSTYWFLFVQERMHLILKEVREKEFKFNKEYKDLEYSKVPSELEEAQKKMMSEFKFEIKEYVYNQMFMPALFQLKNYFNIEYKIISKTVNSIHYEIYKTDGTLLLEDKFSLAYGYLFGEMNKKFNKIYTYLRNDITMNDAEHIMNSLHHEMNNTDKKIVEWFFPKPREKYNV